MLYGYIRKTHTLYLNTNEKLYTRHIVYAIPYINNVICDYYLVQADNAIYNSIYDFYESSNITVLKEVPYSESKQILSNIHYKGPNGTEYTFKNGVLHSYNLQPAAILPHFYVAWYKDGNLHADDDRPAYQGTNGDLQWWKNGYMHRDNDRPALIQNNGQMCQWWRNGKCHRDGDKPAIKYINPQYKMLKWFIEGLMIREHSKHTIEIYTPLSKSPIRKWTNVFGQIHRLFDQPAVVYPNGTKEWWLYDVMTRENGKYPVELSANNRYWCDPKKFIIN